jgi:hypothetical protein
VNDEIQMDKNRSDYGDKYFTCEDVIIHHIDTFASFWEKDFSQMKQFFDFSAGNGEFSQFLKAKFPNLEIKQIDLSPLHPAIEKIDFFKFQNFESFQGSVVGYNPPFGRGGNLAMKFIEHAFQFHPQGMLLILPLRPWNFQGFDIMHKEILPSDSFYYPDTRKKFDTASVFLILKKNSHLPLKVSSNQDGFLKVEDTGKLLHNHHFLLIRKVGFYAGQQFYCLIPKENNMEVIYIDQKGTVFPLEILNFQNFRETPWARNGHIVCEQDISEKEFKGSNPNQKKNDDGKKRKGLGFLKCFVSSEYQSMTKLIELAQKIRNLVQKYECQQGCD